MRPLGTVLLAFAVVASVTTAPARDAACGGRPALTAGCCCKHKSPPPKAPCCAAAPATSDAALLSGVTGVAPDLVPAATAVLAELRPVAAASAAEATVATSPPGSPPLFLLDCTFRI
jgi:hypothetical protein